MNTYVTLKATDLCALALCGYKWDTQPRYQACARIDGDLVTMYLTADEARDIALHFTKLADLIDAEMAAADIPPEDGAIGWRCFKSAPDRGYVCTLFAGHDGDHIAHGPDDEVCATWPQTVEVSA